MLLLLLLLDEAFVEPFRESWFELGSVGLVDEVDWLATRRRDSPPWVLMVSNTMCYRRPFFFSFFFFDSEAWKLDWANKSLRPSRCPSLGDSERSE